MSGERTVIATSEAPAAIGPYSQAIVVPSGRLVFCSGQIPLSPVTGQLVGDDIATQTEQVMKNLEAVLRAAGCDFSHVARTTIFLASLADFAVVNGIYGRYFPSAPPARVTIQAAALPRGALVEIDAIAVVP
jgi:2-iminobutanoate/2-iminopropanoate deaminase